MTHFRYKMAALWVCVTAVLQSGNVQAQGCPACSNPALQSSEKLEIGKGHLEKGQFRYTLNVTNGNDYKGGHPDHEGIDENGNMIHVPEHHHEVIMDFIRFEGNFEYTYARDRSIWLRLPYDVKMQVADIRYGANYNYTQKEKEAIERNRDNHHRTENYLGVNDLKLLHSFRFNQVITKKDQIDLAIGTTLPVGTTEENPLKAGREGRKHLHIQNGTGTFNPMFEAHYVMGLGKKWTLALFSMNEVPFYANKKGFQAPKFSTDGWALSRSVGNNWALRGSFSSFYQSVAKWDGETDPNSGSFALNAMANVTYRTNNGWQITPGYRIPLYQQNLVEGGDGYTYGPTFLLNVSKAFDLYGKNKNASGEENGNNVN